MQNSSKGAALIALLLLGLTAQASATIVTYNLTPLGGNNYQYEYTVHNNTLGNSLTDFAIFFPDVYSVDNFAYTLVSSAGAGWTSDLIPPSAPDLGGYAEWYGGSIAAGASASVFAVQFTFTGSGTLGSQPFVIYDSALNELDSGFTQQAVPEPSTLIAGALSLLAFVGSGFRKFAKR